MTQQQFFERYQFNTDTDHLGEGGFGEVFKAYDTHLDRWVAIKKSQFKKGMENFSLQKEVELATNLPTHPNIAHYEACYRFDIPMLGSFDFGILQYYEEGNLSALRKAGKITKANRDSILEGILNGLSHLHKHNVIHRDIKPANILIVKRGNDYIPKITDFGISKQGSNAAASSVSNSLAGGTYSYAAPEQLKGESKIRHNTDLWSFGVIVYQLMTNKLPFEPKTLDTNSEAARNEVTSLILSGKLPSDIDFIEQPYRTIIKNCLVLDKMVRAQSAEDLLEILHGKTTSTKTPPTFGNSQSSDKTKIEIKDDDISKQLADDKTIAEKPETRTEPQASSRPKGVNSKPETTPPPQKKKNKILIPSLIIGALLAVVLFIWQPWNSQPETQNPKPETQNSKPETNKPETPNSQPETSKPETNNSKPVTSIPTLSTGSATNLTETSASLSGNITNAGNGTISERGIVYSTGSNPTTNSNKLRSGSGSGNFTASLSSLQSNTKYYARAYAINEAGTAYGNEVSFTTKQKELTSTKLKIGDTHAGGIIFYIDGTGQHGLVCAPYDQSINSEWGCYETAIYGTSTSIGSGQSNTNKIVNACSDSDCAARICSNLVLNGYSDWFLPSKDELNLMYNNLHKIGIGSFANFRYWSSSEYSGNEAVYAWRQDFSNGSQHHGNKYFTYYVRAVRAF